MQRAIGVNRKISNSWDFSVFLSHKRPSSGHNKSANAWTYRGTFYRSISSGQTQSATAGTSRSFCHTKGQQVTRYLTIIISNCLDLSRSSPRSLQRPSAHGPLLQASPLQLHMDNQPPLPCNSKCLDLQNGTFFKYLAHVNMFYFAFYF